MNNGTLFFFIGTEAELIKIFPVILECKKAGLVYHIIASGQNDIKNSVILQKTECGYVELELSQEKDIRKSAIGLFSWWVNTYRTAQKRIRKEFPNEDFDKAYMIVHGDTVSTYMGARIGKNLGMTVCHVEAGLRSHKLFNPFPEEIDRLLTSRIARLHFAPGDEAEKNLKKAKGKVINTKQNSLLDSLRISKNIESCEEIRNICENKKPYFVFVMHRQENLADDKLVKKSVANVIEISKQISAIVILHAITKNTFEKLNILDDLKASVNVTLLSRVDYISFMKLLDNSEFVITDGGSNQEELYYMGKPTLIMRKATERNEGLGKNAILFSCTNDMLYFSEKYENFSLDSNLDYYPAKEIIRELIKFD